MISLMIKQLRYIPKICCHPSPLLPLPGTRVYSLICLLPTSKMPIQKRINQTDTQV